MQRKHVDVPGSVVDVEALINEFVAIAVIHFVPHNISEVYPSCRANQAMEIPDGTAPQIPAPVTRREALLSSHAMV